ncbi:MAG TPA: hypothetical protein VND99_03645 [Candidatus Acidoferrales bacterium]|nr:hypothetical protein [Candidatus Acidoferrales bacterium]
MTALAVERTGTLPQLQITKHFLPEKRSGIVVVGSTTIFHNGIRQGTSSRPAGDEISPADRRKLSRDTLGGVRAQLEQHDVHFQLPVFGHAAKLGLGIATMLNTSEVQTKPTPINVYTWADAKQRERLGAELDRPDIGLSHEIFEINGDMPEAVTYAVTTNSDRERTIFSMPPQGGSHDIDIAKDKLPEHVFLGSLPEQFLRHSLDRMINKLHASQTPYTFIPGAVTVTDEGISKPLLKAVAKAASLVVTEDELRNLVASQNTPDKMKDLMEQGLSLMDSGSLFVVLHGGNVLGATKRDTKITQVAATPPMDYLNADDYRDAVAIGTLRGSALEDKLKSGIISASFTIKTDGTFEPIPAGWEIDFRNEMSEPKITYP